jgi:uncharacterized protein
MALSMYQSSVPVFVKMLGNLSAILHKAAAHAEAKKIEPRVLLEGRLYPDMFTLIRQVQIATDQAKGCAARLADVEVPKYDDNETTFADLEERIQKTIAFVKSVPAEKIDGSEEREVSLPMRGQSVTFKGMPYLIDFVLPNFYFHLTTTYAILRHSGVDVGKRDFLGVA